MPHAIDGFLGTRASFMLDVVSLAMVIILPVLSMSIYLVRCRCRYALHKRIQLTLGVVLLLTVAAFEADMRVNGWRDRAAASPYVSRDGSIDWVAVALGIHLCFAVSTALLWAIVIIQALRRFPKPPAPAAHSRWHRRVGYCAAFDVLMTAVTGWIFYWLAFVA